MQYFLSAALRLACAFTLLATAAAVAPQSQVLAAIKGQPRRLALARVSTHRGQRAHQLSTQTAPSLTDAIALLESISEGLGTSYAQVSSELVTARDACEIQYASLKSRAEWRRSEAEQKSATRQQQLSVGAGLQAQLTNIQQKETDAQQSYDSTVSQRSQAAQNFEVSNGTHTAQINVMQDVLAKLEEQKSVITSANTTVDYQATEMDHIVGVFSSLLDTARQNQADDAADYAKAAEDFRTLVKTHKAQLDHVIAEQSTKSQRLSDAEAAAQALAEENVLLLELSKNFSAPTDALFHLCGSDGAKIPASLTGNARIRDNLLTRVQQTIQTMEELNALAPASTAAVMLLQEERKSMHRQITAQAHRGSQRPSAYERDQELDREAAHAWNALRDFEGQGAMTLESKDSAVGSQGTPRRVAALTSLTLKLVSGANTSVANDTSGNATLSQERSDCVVQKKALQAQIITAQGLKRQSNATARKDALAAQARARQAALLADELNRTTSMKTNLATAWQGLVDIQSTAAFALAIQDAQSELVNISAIVESYISDPTAPPKAASLRVAVSGIESSVSELLSGVQGDVSAIVSAQGSLFTKFASIEGAISSKGNALTQEERALNASSTAASQEAAKQETDLQTLAADQSDLEAQCNSTFLTTALLQARAPQTSELTAQATAPRKMLPYERALRGYARHTGV